MFISYKLIIEYFQTMAGLIMKLSIHGCVWQSEEERQAVYDNLNKSFFRKYFRRKLSISTLNKVKYVGSIYSAMTQLISLIRSISTGRTIILTLLHDWFIVTHYVILYDETFKFLQKIPFRNKGIKKRNMQQKIWTILEKRKWFIMPFQSMCLI